MGGNLLGTRRVSTKELEEVFVPFLNSLFGNGKLRVIPTLFSKESHGDIDTATSLSPNAIEEILIEEELLYVREKSFISFLKDGVQIDINCLQEEDLDFFVANYSWNGFGGFLGKLLRAYGMKLSVKGLFKKEFSIVTPDHFVYIFITKDILEVLDILLLDKEVYLKGFNTYEDIHNFLESSPYFIKEVFVNLTKTKEKRGEKTCYREYGEILSEKEIPFRLSPRIDLELLVEKQQTLENTLKVKEKFLQLFPEKNSEEMQSFLRDFVKEIPKETLKKQTEKELYNSFIKFYKQKYQKTYEVLDSFELTKY